MISIDGREYAMPLFERRGVRDAAVRGCALQVHAELHGVDEVDPGGQVLLAALEHASGEGVVLAAACAALEALEHGYADPGPPRIRSDCGIRAPQRRRQAARNRWAKATRRTRDAGPFASWTIVPSAQAPTRQNRRQTKSQVGARVHSLLAETIIAASGRYHRRSVLGSIRFLNSVSLTVRII